MLETPKLGPLLRKKRQSQGRTLEEVAAASGVSRSMLSQVERGEANPTFATLWSLTQALGVSIDDLVSAGDPGAEQIAVADRAATPRLEGNGSGATLWLLAPPGLVGSVEWYELLLEPGGRLTSSAHAAGTSEHLTVLDGAVTVQSGGRQVDVTSGATARYSADVEHEIANPHSTAARVLLVVLGSEGT